MSNAICLQPWTAEAGQSAQSRAHALFASRLDPSDACDPHRVRDAVNGTLQAVGETGCTALVATEYGDHPETAVARMSWALRVVRDTYVMWP